VDGRFVLQQVPPGDYYVLAQAAGYLLPVGSPEDGDVSKHFDELMRDVTVVHVTGDGIAQANITLHRGGVIAGRVTFDDGLPAAKVSISLMRKDARMHYENWPAPFFTMMSIQERNRGVTDDDGYFRIAGIAPGKYVLNTDIPLSYGQRNVGTAMKWSGFGILASTLSVYYPNAFRRSGAKTLEIDGAERLMEADIFVDLKGLRTIRGRVHVEDGTHVPDRGYVVLTDSEEKTYSRRSLIAPDGTYEFDLVPAGTYTLMVEDAADVADPVNAYNLADPNLKVTKRYEADEYDVIVGAQDVTVEDVLLDEEKPDDTVKPQ
jgi:hypothetical protein